MTDIFSGILIVLGLTLVGYSLIWPFSSIGIRISERLLLGAAISLGLIPLFLFYGLLAGGRLGIFSPWVLMTGAVLGFALWVVDLRHARQQRAGRFIPPVHHPRSRYQVLLVGIIAILLIEKVFFVAIQGFSFPTYFWDAIDNWNYRAKVLYSTGYLDLDPRSETFLGGGKPHYPMGPSLLRAWMATLVGHWSEKVVALHSMMAYILLFAMIWNRLSRSIGRRDSFLFAYLAVSLPLMVHHAYSSYADLLLSLFFTGCLIYGYEYLITKDRLSGIVSAFFLVSSLFTKNEGLVLIFPVVMVAMLVAIWQRRLLFRSACFYVGAAVFLILPWVILKFYFGLSLTPNEEKFVFEVHLNGLVKIFDVLFRQGSFNLFGPLLIVSTLFYSTIWWRTELRLLAFAVFLFLGAILGVFLLSGNYAFLENQMTINRSLMLFMPPYLYLVGLSAGRQQGQGLTMPPGP